MKKTCIIGTGNRFRYFMKIFDYLISKKYICIEGISNRSNKFDNNVKKYTKNLFNNYKKMISQINPDLVFIFVNNENNSKVLSDICSDVNMICIETPLTNINDKLLKKFENKKIHIMENWFFLPLEIIKKKILKSNILGNLNMICNKNRTFKYHGVSQLRNYVDFNNNYIFNKNKSSKFNKLELIQYEPKIKDDKLSKIVFYFSKNKIISDCIIKDNQLNFECYDNDNNSISKLKYKLKDSYLSHIEIDINNKIFIWNDEYNLNIDQNQYGSLKSIISFLENNFIYSPENHLKDLL